MSLKIVLIGTGNIAHKHFAALVDNKYASICGIYDIDAEIGHQFAKKYQLKQFDSLEESINSCDIVSVCTPHHLHAPIIKRALEAGKICISEKPLCLQKSEFTNIKSNQKTRLYMITQNRFNSAVQTVRKILTEGKLGRILYCSGATRWFRPFEYYENSWKGMKLKEGGMLYNQGIHLLDLCHWLLNLDINDSKIVFANKRLLNAGYSIETENYMSVILQNNSLPINLEFANCITDKNFENSLLIVGDKATIKIGGASLNKIEYSSILLRNNAELLFGNSDIYGYGHINNYNAILESILDSKLESDACGFQQAIDTVSLIEDIYSSCNKHAK